MLAVPWGKLKCPEVAGPLNLNGKILVDCTNLLEIDYSGSAVG
jgi:predicted dinucleotide-binding enzyme